MDTSAPREALREIRAIALWTEGVKARLLAQGPEVVDVVVQLEPHEARWEV
jgi:hypothetical protein